MAAVSYTHLGIRHGQAQRQGVGPGVHGRIDEIQLCRHVVLAAIGEQQPELALAGVTLIHGPPELALYLQHALLADAEVRPHRILSLIHI